MLGSASPELLRQSSETLAGRIAYHNLGGFDLREVGVPALERLWRRGGFPTVTPSLRIALADLKLSSLEVIHAGDHRFEMAKGIRAIPVDRILEDIRPLR